MAIRLGVVGAGTMGAGIAQLGCGAGMDTALHDPVPEALERGAEQVRKGLARWAAKSRVEPGAHPPGAALEGFGQRIVQQRADPGSAAELRNAGAHRAGADHAELPHRP